MHKIAFVASGFLAIAGIALLASQIGDSSSDSLRGAGLFLFSCGILAAAVGFYLPARRLKTDGEAIAAVKKKKSDRVCSVCNDRRAEVFCRVHVARLCLVCLSTHDDGRNCLYVPATRASAAYK
jgi:hypothetical protein